MWAGKLVVLGAKLARALVALLLATQGLLAAAPCLLAAPSPAMAYSDGMSGPCGGAGSAACLASCLQAYQAPGQERGVETGFVPAPVAPHPETVLPAHPACAIQQAPAPSTAAPPYLLYCRLRR